ncbi:hypothetical protein [Mycoplasma sp. 1654_15]|uniref:hypothetical protein n=1 Tax=Mycoplasma sp. 1654_15 TaxID=2725994 RepID=UPI001449C206|nr:hypothetical protein [Mycoplasma sp. 1654_15]QJB71031.1 hypothetical protein HF996_00670 [Mycoplasma sp. 1654_15]
MDKKIYLYIHDSETIIVKKGSYIRGIKSIEGESEAKKKHWPELPKIRIKYGISDKEYELTEDVKFVGEKIENIIQSLTTLILWYNRALANVKNKNGESIKQLKNHFN